MLDYHDPMKVLRVELEQRRLLRVLLIISVGNVAVLALCTLLGRIHVLLALSVLLFSLCAWYFGIAFPAASRHFRAHLKATRWESLGRLVELMGLFVLILVQGLFVAANALLLSA